MSYYQSSGKFNLVGLLLGGFTAIVLSAALAYLYVQVGAWISFIIVKFALLGISIYAVLEILKLSSRVAKNRNKAVSYFLITLCALSLTYFSWFFFIVIELGQSFSEAFTDFFVYIQLVFEAQAYTVGTPMNWFTGRSGREISDWETYVILGIESLALLIGPIIAQRYDHLDTLLFCESCNKWIKNVKTIRKDYTRVFDRQELEKMLETEDLSELMELPGVDIDKNIKYTVYEIKLYECQNCPSKRYIKIKIDNTDALGKRNKVQQDVLIDYYKIENEAFFLQLMRS